MINNINRTKEIHDLYSNIDVRSTNKQYVFLVISHVNKFWCCLPEKGQGS